MSTLPVNVLTRYSNPAIHSILRTMCGCTGSDTMPFKINASGMEARCWTVVLSLVPLHLRKSTRKTLLVSRTEQKADMLSMPPVTAKTSSSSRVQSVHFDAVKSVKEQVPVGSESNDLDKGEVGKLVQLRPRRAMGPRREGAPATSRRPSTVTKSLHTLVESQRVIMPE